MGLEIVPASDADYRIVKNLARFYMYDIAADAGWSFSADGLFEPEDRFANYWRRCGAQRAWPSGWRGFPFLLRVDGRPAGFALVKRLSEAPAVFDMSELFVARQYRGRGIGRRVASDLFDAFGGSWEVREIPANAPARHFWRAVIAVYTGGAFTETRETFAAYQGREYIVQRFHARRRPRAGAMTIWAP